MNSKVRKSLLKAVREFNLKSFVPRYLINAQSFPFIMSVTVLAILFVLFRMKGIEQDYAYNELSIQIQKAKNESKDLMAKKAYKLSLHNLRQLAVKHNLNEPTQEQIIVIQ